MRVLRIFISPSHNYFGRHGLPAGETPMIEVAEAQCFAGRGIQDDRFFDFKPDYKGQITFFSFEVYQELCDELAVFDKDALAFRRNVLVEGQDLNALVRREFEVQGIRFLGTEQARPCYWMEQAFCIGAEKALQNRGGLRARILTDGVLHAESPQL